MKRYTKKTDYGWELNANLRICGDVNIYNNAIDALGAYEDGEEQGMDWVSVKDRLPSRKYAVKNGDIIACDKRGDYHFIHWCDFKVRADEFTHWMPLTGLPKGEQ